MNPSLFRRLAPQALALASAMAKVPAAQAQDAPGGMRLFNPDGTWKKAQP